MKQYRFYIIMGMRQMERNVSDHVLLSIKLFITYKLLLLLPLLFVNRDPRPQAEEYKMRSDLEYSRLKQAILYIRKKKVL